MNEIWGTLLYPGECFTIFSQKQERIKAISGIVLRWRWKTSGGFDISVARHCYDHELEEAFLTCLDIGERLFPSYPKGIELFSEDREMIESRKIYLSGGSLALAFLLGMLTFIHDKRWPNGVVAWGVILPDRKNSFRVHSVDWMDRKLDLAKKIGADIVIHPASEKNIGTESIREIKVAASIDEAIFQLESILRQKGI